MISDIGVGWLYKPTKIPLKPTPRRVGWWADHPNLAERGVGSANDDWEVEGGSRLSNIWVWINTWLIPFLGNEHPFTNYFDVNYRGTRFWHTAHMISSPSLCPNGFIWSVYGSLWQDHVVKPEFLPLLLKCLQRPPNASKVAVMYRDVLLYHKIQSGNRSQNFGWSVGKFHSKYEYRVFTSGKRLHNYGKSPFIVDFPMKIWWIFP